LGHTDEPSSFANVTKKTPGNAFHARAPSDIPDNPFASIEAIRGSPPSSPLHKPSSLAPVTEHVPLIPIAEPYVPRNGSGAVSAAPFKINTAKLGSSLSGTAKSFTPRSNAHKSFENTDRVPGRVAIRKMDDAFVGAAGVIGGGV
jgi:hypothetical protein